jgi:hypothetical protein
MPIYESKLVNLKYGILMANENNGVKVYDDGKGGQWIKHTDSDTRVHIDKNGKANVFDSKKQKK